MNKTPPYWNKAKKNLIKKDKIMKDLIKKYSDKILTTRKDVFFFFMQKYNWATNKYRCSQLSIFKI